jgi:hypothetical protein
MEIMHTRKKIFRILTHSFAIIILSACKPAAAPSADSEPASTAVTETAPAAISAPPDKGTVHALLNASGDPAVTYALYIPQSCSDGKKWPLLLLFDPQGQGTVPLKKYKDIAENHHMILLCSNTSKNGMSPEQNNQIIKVLLNEAMKQLPGDSSRIYAGGFSGGGRVATLVLPQYKALKGIISIASGSLPSPIKTCRYIGVAGLQDFNYKEVKESAAKLEGVMPVTTLYHDGIHEWCPSTLMDEVMVLLDADAMRNKTLAVNTALLQKEAAAARQDAGAQERTGNIIAAADRLSFAMDCLKDLLEDKELSAYYKRLTTSPAYEKSKTGNDMIDKTQEMLTSKYVQMIGQPLEQWKNAIDLLNAEVNKTKDSPLYFMYKRVLASLSIQCYMLCRKNIYNTNIKDAAYLSELYLMIDPENKDAHYYAAVLAARNSNPDKVLKELNESIKLGFSDRELLMSENAFRNISNTASFNQLLQTIETAQQKN